MPKGREGGAEKKDHHSTDKRGYRAHDRKEGGGKGGWGIAGKDDQEPAPAAIDQHDPNFVDPSPEPAQEKPTSTAASTSTASK